MLGATAAGLVGGATLTPFVWSNQAVAAATNTRLHAPRWLTLHHLHTNETLTIAYHTEGRYQPEALRRLSYFLRDYRAGLIKTIHPRLFDLMFVLQYQMNTRGPWNIFSGYRCPATNARLRERSRRVARSSYHIRGMAIDLNLPGASLSTLRRTAWNLQAGGVGFYPGSDFVHLDVGPVRSW